MNWQFFFPSLFLSQQWIAMASTQFYQLDLLERGNVEGQSVDQSVGQSVSQSVRQPDEQSDRQILLHKQYQEYEMILKPKAP